MFGSSTQPASSIQEWERAGYSLSAALDKYLDLSESLWTRSSREGIPSKTLASRIDSALVSFDYILHRKCASARSTLSQTRNRIVSPIYRFPNEVLSEIFAQAIYTPLNPSKPIPMRDSLVKMYCSLYSLIGVCTLWRNVALHQHHFWSMIPIIELDSSLPTFKFNQATKLSLERSGKVDLHLAIIREDQQWSPLLVHDASRVRTINITTRTLDDIQSAVAPFLEHGSTTRLSHLSLRLQKKEPLSIRRDSFISFSENSTRNYLNKLLGNLCVLRLCGTLVDFNQINFSNKLVELCIQQVTLGYDREIAKLLKALSSAVQLQDLGFVMITTFPNVQITKNTLKISLPNLKHLLLQDLYHNTMQHFLESITSCSHHLTLHLKKRCRQIYHPLRSELENININDLYELLRQVSVHTLLINGEDEDEWLNWTEFAVMMRSMPDLKTFRMHSWDFDTNWCAALTWPESRSNRLESSIPALENIYLSGGSIFIEDVGALKRMVTSYYGSLRRMVLGVELNNESEGDEDIILWLKRNIPEFELIEDNYYPPELQVLEWQLW